ncbi:MAG: hypothetical protein WC327_06835 [Candidatus Cloacimonadia bacterium]
MEFNNINRKTIILVYGTLLLTTLLFADTELNPISTRYRLADRDKIGLLGNLSDEPDTTITLYLYNPPKLLLTPLITEQNNTLTNEFLLDYLTTLLNDGKIGRLQFFVERDNQFLTSDNKTHLYNQIGRYYSERRLYYSAIHSYQESLKIKRDDNIQFEIERAKFAAGEYRDSEEFILSQLRKYPDSFLNDNLVKDLAKYYYTQKQYQKVVDFIDQHLNKQSYQSSADSLYYFSAAAHKELNNNDTALQTIRLLLNSSKDTKLQSLTLSLAESILLKIDVRKSYDFINRELEYNPNESLHNSLISILARVFENSYQYADANELYFKLAETASDTELIDLFSRIAVNLMYLRENQKALFYLDYIQNNSDNIQATENALFLSYLANYSLSNYETALKILLNLYLEYPESHKRFDIAKNLIELLIDLDMPLFAYRVLNDYYLESKPSQQFILDGYYRRLFENNPEVIADLLRKADFRPLFKYLHPEVEEIEN